MKGEDVEENRNEYSGAESLMIEMIHSASRDKKVFRFHTINGNVYVNPSDSRVFSYLLDHDFDVVDPEDEIEALVDYADDLMKDYRNAIKKIRNAAESSWVAIHNPEATVCFYVTPDPLP